MEMEVHFKKPIGFLVIVAPYCHKLNYELLKTNPFTNFLMYLLENLYFDQPTNFTIKNCFSKITPLKEDGKRII